jgi:hypothetical protein
MNVKTISAFVFFFILSTGTLISVEGQRGAAPERRIVLLRGDSLVTARQDGSDVRVLIKSGVSKSEPSWSPDRSKIVYRVAGARFRDQATHATLVMIQADGKTLRSIPVVASEADGTVVGGMRFVEGSGWLSNEMLYAVGSVNPYVAEYRILDAASGRAIDSYFGNEFATCAAKGEVAYVATDRAEPGAGRSQVEVNGNVVYTGSGGSSLIENLRWSNDCGRLVFTETSGPAGNFVVINGSALEARIPLPAGTQDSLTITPYEKSFLLQSDRDTATAYDAVTRSLRARSEMAKELNRVTAARERIVLSLGGRSADGWTDPRPVAPRRNRK